MKTILVSLIILVSLSGCGAMDRTTAKLTGYSRMCVDGVSYLQFTSGSTIQVDREGKPVTC